MSARQAGGVALGSAHCLCRRDSGAWLCKIQSKSLNPKLRENGAYFSHSSFAWSMRSTQIMPHWRLIIQKTCTNWQNINDNGSFISSWFQRDWKFPLIWIVSMYIANVYGYLRDHATWFGKSGVILQRYQSCRSCFMYGRGHKVHFAGYKICPKRSCCLIQPF